MRGAVIWAVMAVAVLPAAWAQDPARVHVMVVNDDGVDAPGLAALVEVLAADPGYRVTVVAPATHQSGMGHSLTLRGEIPLAPHAPLSGAPTWAVGATPATTARVGLITVLADDPPDLVVAGINRGENVGRIAWYSGTVGAAREAVLSGIPAIAFSLQLDWTDPRPDYRAAARWAKPLIDAVSRVGLPEGVLLNVNLPRDAAATRGYRVARMGLAEDTVSGFEVVRTEGGTRILKAIWSPARDDELGTDNHALAHGWVSIAPLGLDQSSLPALATLVELNWLEGPAAAGAEPVAATAP